MTETNPRTTPQGKADKSDGGDGDPSVKDRLEAFRLRHPKLDHLVRMLQHYGAVKGNNQAGAVTYFGFLSFFPILALAFFLVGYVAQVYPDAREALVEAIDEVLPGMVGDGDGQISLDAVRRFASTAGLVGVVGVLYSGLNWLSALRDGLLVIFEMPQKQQPNFVVGKLRDLLTLVIIGVTLLLSVTLSGMVTGFSREVLDFLGLGTELGWLLTVLSVLIGGLVGMLLFFVMFKALARPPESDRTLWYGAMVGAIAFEALKWASSYLIGLTKGQPAFQAFGISLILLVWINYFARVVLYAAAWAHTSRAARSLREQVPGFADGRRQDGPVTEPAAEVKRYTPAEEERASKILWFTSGAAGMWALIAALRRKR